MFPNFDPELFTDPDFKEDAVREVLIAPMLARLGYHAVGKHTVIRSKTLVQPFIYVGTRRHPVKIIPDYTLRSEGKPVLILDAKSPVESVTSTANVQQAYSYAIHPEVRCQHFALCNGKQLALYTVNSPEPVLLLPFEEYLSRWSDIERHLSPKYLLQPELRNLKPDFGFRISQMGTTKESDLLMFETRLGMFARVSDDFYTASVNMTFGGEDHCVSYDFKPDLLEPMVAGLPQVLRSQFLGALARAPFQACADLVVEVDLRARLGDPIKVQHETFVPLIIQEVLVSRFNPTPITKEATDIPPHVFRLRSAFQVES
jgi:hypothetical protein